MYLTDAKKEQANELAKLIQLAGDGLPYYLWQIDSHGRIPPLELGSMRIASSSDKNNLSYQNARICLRDGRLAGVAISSKLSESPSLLDLHEHPDPLIPLLMLEAKVPGAWSVSAVSVTPRYRKLGVAKLLMRDAEMLAEQNGCDEIIVVVNSANHIALAMYGALGYTSKDQMPAVPYPNCPAGSHWVLLTLPVSRHVTKHLA